MSSTDTPVGAASAILGAVKANTAAVEAFKDQQVGIFTSTDATANITDADGNTKSVPTWSALNAQIAALQTQVTNAVNDIAGGLVIWDAQSTEITLPFKLVQYGYAAFNSGLADGSDQPQVFGVTTIDPTGLIATCDTSENPAVFKVDGVIPPSGKYWFTVSLPYDSTGSDYTEVGITIATDGRAYLYTDGVYTNTTSLARLALDRSGGFSIYDSTGATVASNTLDPTTTIVVLVCIDVDNSAVSFYGTVNSAATTLATITVDKTGPQFGPNVSLLARSAILANIYPDVNLAESATFNATDASVAAPNTIPSGFVGLTAKTAVLPSTIKEGVFFVSNTFSGIGSDRIEGGVLYCYSSQGLIPVPELLNVPLLTEENKFSKPQVLQSFGIASDAHNTGVGISSDNLVILNQRTGASTGFFNTIAQGNTSAANYPQSFTAIGDGLGNLDTVNYFNVGSVAVGGFFNKATQVNESVALGVGVGYAIDVCSKSVLIGLSAGNWSSVNVANSVVVGAIENANSPLGTFIPNAAYYPTFSGLVAIGHDVMGGAVVATTGTGPYTTNFGGDVLIGDQAGNRANFHSGSNVLIGSNAGYNNVLLGSSVAVGAHALSNGNEASDGGTTGGLNVAIGPYAAYNTDFKDSGAYNIAIGYNAIANATMGSNNIGIGHSALSSTPSTSPGVSNAIAIGNQAFAGSNSVSIGSNTGSNTSLYQNAVCLGYQSSVTADNQIQLGNSSTTVYAYGAVQTRSDIRDKTAVQDTTLGLDFINALRPVDYKWDMREDYINLDTKPIPPAPLAPAPAKPNLPKSDPKYMAQMAKYHTDYQAWLARKSEYDAAYAVYEDAYRHWVSDNHFNRISRDGSKTRQRLHHGLIAQEVKATVDRMGVDFGGWQDHSIKGGLDVQSLGYEELIAPIIKSIQQLDAKHQSTAYLERVVSSVIVSLLHNDMFLDKLANALANRR